MFSCKGLINSVNCTAMTEPSTSSTQPDFSRFFKDDYGVILLRGKNSFGDKIYSYVKVSFGNIDRLQHSLKNRLPFTPSDFGEVIAAGKGEPPEEVKAEIARDFPMVEQKSDTPAAPAAPLAKKAWDEY